MEEQGVKVDSLKLIDKIVIEFNTTYLFYW